MSSMCVGKTLFSAITEVSYLKIALSGSLPTFCILYYASSLKNKKSKFKLLTLLSGGNVLNFTKLVCQQIQNALN